MKKLILPLVIIMFLLTGCSIKQINNLTINEIVDYGLSINDSKANKSFKGYKIYLPNDMTIINDEKENNVFYSKGNKYYLYVDIVSYYKKIVNDYKINDSERAFYSKILNDSKKGYILITKQDNNYFLEVMYNYSKIEVVTKNYKEALLKSIIILNSIEYNDKIIESLIGKNTINYNEEEYNYLNPSENTSSFLEWKEMYGEYKPSENELPDEDKIDIDIVE